MAKNDKTAVAEAPVDEKSAEFLERVQLPVGEETARERYERVQREAKELLAGLKAEAKEADNAAKNQVIDEVVMPAFEKIIAEAEEFTGLTIRRLSLRYTHGKGEEPEFKSSHTISKARGEGDTETDEK